MAGGPLLPTTSNCPASSRAMASTDSNGKAAPGSAADSSDAFAASQLRKTQIAGTESPAQTSLPDKEAATWRTFFFSSCRAASARW
jgi:hypothetical protein